NYFEECLAIVREQDDKQGIVGNLERLGQVALYRGEYTAARARLEEGLAISHILKNEDRIARILIPLGQTLLTIGDLNSANMHLIEALTIMVRRSARSDIVRAMELLASIAAAQGDPARAARLWGAAEALSEQIGAPMWPVDRPEYERRVAATRA